MKSPHTPGPWSLRKANYWGRTAYYVDPPEKSSVAVVLMDRRGPLLITEEDKANARLIAAAPELVAACRAALALLTGDGWDGTLGHHKDNPIPVLLRAAIAKAEKEQQL